MITPRRDLLKGAVLTPGAGCRRRRGQAPTADTVHRGCSSQKYVTIYRYPTGSASPHTPARARPRRKGTPTRACGREGRVLEASDGTPPVTTTTDNRGQPQVASDYQSATPPPRPPPRATPPRLRVPCTRARATCAHIFPTGCYLFFAWWWWRTTAPSGPLIAPNQFLFGFHAGLQPCS